MSRSEGEGGAGANSCSKADTNSCSKGPHLSAPMHLLRLADFVMAGCLSRTCSRISVCMHACMSVCMYLYVCIYFVMAGCLSRTCCRISVCMHVCMHVCMYVCIYICIDTNTYRHMHRYIYILSRTCCIINTRICIIQPVADVLYNQICQLVCGEALALGEVHLSNHTSPLQVDDADVRVGDASACRSRRRMYGRKQVLAYLLRESRLALPVRDRVVVVFVQRQPNAHRVCIRKHASAYVSIRHVYICDRYLEAQAQRARRRSSCLHRSHACVARARYALSRARAPPRAHPSQRASAAQSA
jgi:hypothetical protein